MRFATLKIEGAEQAAIQIGGQHWVPLIHVDGSLQGDLLVLVRKQWPLERLTDLRAKAARSNRESWISHSDAVFAPPYRHPRLIWGIGLNYADHAADLDEVVPEEPASFIKGVHTIVGQGDEIVLPRLSQRVTTEAELGIVIGSPAVGVRRETAPDAVFGVTPVLDQTAEDILRRNPRFLTRSKNFVSFFSFGPEVVTLDEFLDGRPIEVVRVATTINGHEKRVNNVGNMIYGPWDLISSYSEFIPWSPGDIISTGTPGAVPISGGELAEARIDGLTPLQNRVAALHSRVSANTALVV